MQVSGFKLKSETHRMIRGDTSPYSGESLFHFSQDFFLYQSLPSVHHAEKAKLGTELGPEFICFYERTR